MKIVWTSRRDVRQQQEKRNWNGELTKWVYFLLLVSLLLPACHLPLPPPPLLPVRPAIMLETVQVNETSDIISWQPPAEPNGQILHYNIRVYRVDWNGNQVLVDTVREVQATTFDFSARGLNAGTYNIQVGCPCELFNFKVQCGVMGKHERTSIFSYILPHSSSFWEVWLKVDCQRNSLVHAISLPWPLYKWSWGHNCFSSVKQWWI